MQDDRIKKITDRIRIKREELNYPQEYMAMKMQMGQNTYSKIELGHTKLTVQRLFEICEILDIDVIELVSEH